MECFMSADAKTKQGCLLFRGDWTTIARHLSSYHSKSIANVPKSKEEVTFIFPVNHPKVPSEAKSMAKDKYSGPASTLPISLPSQQKIPTPTLALLPHSTPSPHPITTSATSSQVVTTPSSVEDSPQIPLVVDTPRSSVSIASYVIKTEKSELAQVLETLQKLKLDVAAVKREVVKDSKDELYDNDAAVIHNHMKKWRDVKNLVDLCNEVPELELFSGDKGEGGIVRCKTCMADQKQHPSSSNASLCTGMLLPPEKLQLLLDGDGEVWAHFKSKVINHMACATDGATHFKAKQRLAAKNKILEEQASIAQTFMLAAITTIKTKSAALHYETNICLAHMVGGQIGGLGHGRKQFNEVLKTMEVVIDRKSAAYLQAPLLNTGFPPHFWVTVDKATVNRMTNQSVMVAVIVEGKRCAIPIAAPKVYTPAEDGGVEGASASELAANTLEAIKNHLSEACLAQLVGVTADGQYQARDFYSTLLTLLPLKDNGEFFCVTWDPGHWMNLAVTDVRDGKIGSSTAFFKYFIK
jgi:hypothetical protein